MNQKLVEFKVNKNIWNQVLNDPNFRVGFEIECMAKNASSLLMDEEGNLPHDFETYNHKEEIFRSDDYNLLETQVMLSRLFEEYLDLPENEIQLGTNPSYAPGNEYYDHWKIEVDYSLFPERNSLENDDNDAGIELISPIMKLRDGLSMLKKIMDMIQNFRYDNVSLYTTVRTGLHFNISHTGMMGGNFDFAKIAILGGDQHYLEQFSRNQNVYARSLLPFIYNELVAAKEDRNIEMLDNTAMRKRKNALDLLKLRGWDAARVMRDLSSLIPMSHYMSIDFQRLTTDNPYIEFRMAGNKYYERRYDEISSMIMRYCGLIEIACDPNAYREEYLKAVYKLVSSVTPLQTDTDISQQEENKKNPFLLLRLYFRPIMNAIVRNKIDRLENMYFSNTLSSYTGIFYFLAIVRNALILKQANTQRIRQGFNILINILKIDIPNIMKMLRYQNELIKHGVLTPQDNRNQMILSLSNYIKSLSSINPIKPMK